MKEKIGKYEVLEQIGVGGFGEVFKAFDPLIKRHVALKTCTSISEEIRSRFFQEAEIAGNLHHRNITTVYDFGLQDGLPYLVQEYLTGEDLDRKIKRRDPLPFGSKLAWLLQIARGLGAAHAAGVIHRDIKPANIRVLDDGTAKIMDFGIAKLIQQESGLTQTGMTIGTAAYLSPEQVRGDAVDARTDVFSFGVLAYELLTYSRPFEGREISAVLYQVLHAEPRPLVEIWPGAPAAVVALVRRCLEKNAVKRFADGSELARDLERLHLQHGTLRELDNAATTMPLERPDKTPVQGLPSKNAPAPTLDHGAAQVAPTQLSTPRPPLPPPPPATSAAYPPPPPPRSSLPLDRPAAKGRSGIDSFELSASNPIERHEAEPAARGRSRLPTPVLITVGMVLLVVVAAAIGFTLGRGKNAANPAPAPATKPVPQPPDPAPSAGPLKPAAQSVSAQPVKSEPAKTEPPKTEPPKTEPVKAALPEKPKAEAPKNGKILFAAPAWTDAMTVTYGRSALRLDRERTLELKPGTYDLIFQIDEEGYQVNKSVRTTVGSGQSIFVPVPIPEPAALSVRPLPGRPAGEIYLDGQPLGAGTLSRRKVAPGAHLLEILARGGGPGRIRQNVTLEPGRELVVSFDLDKGEAQVVLK